MQRVKVKSVASSGIAFGKVFLLEKTNISVSKYLINDEDKSSEISRFLSALSHVVLQVKVLAENSGIFMAHLEILEDPALTESVRQKIFEENKNAELALDESQKEFCGLFEDIDDEYLKERAVDVKDICSRILDVLKGTDRNPFDVIDEDVIVVADDLMPSDTSLMDFGRVKGFITRNGGYTSHVCIIARDKGIPAFVGLDDKFPYFEKNDFLILDGLHNELIINPDPETFEGCKTSALQYRQQQDELLKESKTGVETCDGHKILLMANAGSVEDVERAMQYGASGIGLFRSEFLYIQNRISFPDEETQFDTYKKLVELCQGNEVIIRTLDIGGDKTLPYFPVEKEENPFLGWRAIRISLDRTDVFRTQLRALLRASAFGKLKIMFPMVISLEELRAARALLEDCKRELLEEGLHFDVNIETGVMIETPAAVLIADDLAQEADFFSIGTNDLTQYILATDRLNPRVARLYNSFHPAVIRSIKQVIDAANKHRKPVGMCGELAGNESAVELLIGMELREFSIAAIDIPRIRQQIRTISSVRAGELATEIIAQKSVSEICSRLGLLYDRKP